MNHQGFDEQVRKALENINTDYQPDSWSLFEQRLSKVPLPTSESEVGSAEEAFDKMIREKVANHQPIPQPSHWQMMSKRLDEYFSIGAWLNRYKVMEIGLTSLFLLTFVNVFYIPNKFDFFNKERRSIDEVASVATYGTVTNNENNIPQAVFSSKNTNEKYPFLKESTPQYSILSIHNDAFVNNLWTEKKEMMSDELMPILQQEVKEITENKIVSQSVKKQLDINIFPILPTNDVKKEDAALTMNRLKVKQPSPWQFALSWVATYDLNHISTPEARFYGTYIPSVSQYCSGFGGGMLVSLQKKRFAFETGLLYNSKTYAPADVRLNALNNVSANAYVATLPDITVRNMQIPLHLRYDVFQKNRLKLYAMAGVTAHLITEAKYDRSRDFVGYALRPFPVATPSEPQEIAPKFTDGYLWTGSWHGNIYGTLNGGIGSSYNLSQKVSIFGQAQYQYHWRKTGIGPNKDELNAYNFWMGLKKSF
jgi:hypothetical protein